MAIVNLNEGRVQEFIDVGTVASLRRIETTTSIAWDRSSPKPNRYE